ncbi:hypothetical protein EYZ11_011264 [Aspergillus tanneri]|uniref:Uncharacterized protein n=1 Tax=Aspergillus tanneri TaxID=1220188 RepID=A0A4S3J378_9EURO|nr:hypothetical protein EYZ11_011264 [Aspergillus tanneri]
MGKVAGSATQQQQDANSGAQNVNHMGSNSL